MVQLTRTDDLGLVKSIMTSPRIYPYFSDDHYPAPADFHPNDSPAIWYMIVHDGPTVMGLFITHPINRELWETHLAILPNFWGITHEIGAACETWLFSQTPCKTAIGFTPESNKLIRRYLDKRGWDKTGIIRSAYRKHGTLRDIHIYQKNKNNAIM